MKKVILLCVFIGTMISSFAQETPSERSKPVLTKQEYLQKSKRQWRGAIIMVSAGGAMAITGLALALNNDNDYNDNNGELGAGLILGGSAVMLGSLGFSIPATINKRRAMSVSFKNELAPTLQRSMVFYKSIPSLSLKIEL